MYFARRANERAPRARINKLVSLLRLHFYYRLWAYFSSCPRSSCASVFFSIPSPKQRRGMYSTGKVFCKSHQDTEECGEFNQSGIEKIIHFGLIILGDVRNRDVSLANWSGLWINKEII